MSSNLMSTEKGGEQTQYEGEYTDVVPHKKSGGQLGTASTTTDPSQADGAEDQRKERGEKTAENIRYGQTISEGGLSGYTKDVSGQADANDSTGDAEESRRAAGYGGKDGREKDMNREVGA